MKRLPSLYLVILIAAFTLASACSRQDEPARVIKVTMKKYAVDPAEIRVRKGEKVRLEVSTPDVQHGFDIPELKVSEPVNPGKPAVFNVPTDRAGTFRIECGIICGPMHDDMRGMLVVE